MTFDIPYVDLTIQFIGASGLPKMDVVGLGDPYFVARLDDKISFVSTVKLNTLSPVWNEVWNVKNVPGTATLLVEVLDKDNAATDDYIGRFSTTINPGAKGVEIEGLLLKRHRGVFWLKIDSTPSTGPNPRGLSYVFDGPIRFSRHFSPMVGLLTNLNQARLYSTWKMYIKGVRLFFDSAVQPWNRNYKAAQSIFQGPGSAAVRASIQAGHRMLYARSTRNGFGIINNKADIFDILHGGGKDMDGRNGNFMHRIKPAVYTYIIAMEDESFRFSETGAAFFVDIVSKHALHSNCAEAVRYSGEFHPRPKGGWQNFQDDTSDEEVEWEFVIDNNSGTYSPDAMLLPALKACLEYNFPGFSIVALDFHDPALKESTDACRAYATTRRGIKEDELLPNIHHSGGGGVTS